MPAERVAVGIVGAGPAGLLLARLLALADIPCVVVERQSRAYVEARIRAGVLERGTVALLEEAGVAARLARECLVHDGVELVRGERALRIDFRALTGHAVVVYGQTEIQRDLGLAVADGGGVVHYGCSAVELADLEAARARLSFEHDGRRHHVECDFIAGCDGFHGVSRMSIPAGLRREYERVYPVGWLGVLADVPPVAPELIYAAHPAGFALCSMRSSARSRYYVQVAADEDAAAWSDERFWAELRRRLPAAVAARLVTGPSLEKSVAPLRSFVAEPLRHGRLFLAGDAAHIVPPTGAKGLNLATGDVGALAAALRAYYASGDQDLLEAYSPTRLARVWQAERFSWWFTSLTHRLGDDPFAERLQAAEFAHLAASREAQVAFARGYVGLDGAVP